MANLGTIVKGVIDKLGKVEITLTQNTVGAYNPATSTYASGTQATDSFYVYPDKVKKNLIDGDNIKLSDLVIYFSPETTTLTPAQNDLITFKGENYKIVYINDIYFKGEIPLLFCVVRKS